MITNIKISNKENNILDDILIPKEFDLSDLPNKKLVLLHGANGVGKSTLIDAIKMSDFIIPEGKSPKELNIKELRKYKDPYYNSLIIARDDEYKDFRILKYRNSKDSYASIDLNRDNDISSIVLYFDSRCLSEGQNVALSIYDYLRALDEFLNTEFKDIFVIVLLDEIDSGISCDNIESIMNMIKRIIKNHDNIQIFMSFNNPYVIKYCHYVLSMYDGKIHYFKTPKDMIDDIKDHKSQLVKLRGRFGSYKIFD